MSKFLLGLGALAVSAMMALPALAQQAAPKVLKIQTS
jgi:hypothetical protein